MENLCKKLIDLLKEKSQTISFMESCTGGFLSNEITNIDGASEIIKVSLITYSNEYKEKFGVDKNTINTYNVYSNRTSSEMSIKCSEFANSDWGVGITGQIGQMDIKNQNDKINVVYFSIYNRNKNKTIDYKLTAKGITKLEKKEYIAKRIFNELINTLGGNNEFCK